MMSYQEHNNHPTVTALAILVASYGFWTSNAASVSAGSTAGPEEQLDIALEAAAGTIEGVRVVNNFVVILSRPDRSKKANQIRLYDRRGNQVAFMDPLKTMEGAYDAGIWDVSVGSSGLVAVAAVFVDQSRRPSASLLTYNTKGALLRALALNAEREIIKLQVDPEGNVWALGSGSGKKDPGQVPMVTRYDSSGQVRDFLPRATLPSNAHSTEQGPDWGGSVAFGLAGNQVWFFLPFGRLLVTMNQDGSGVTVAPTGEPVSPLSFSANETPSILVNGVCLLPGGSLLAHWTFGTRSERQAGLYQWRPATSRWEKITVPELSSRSLYLTGIDADRLVMERLPASGHMVRLAWLPIPSPPAYPQ